MRRFDDSRVGEDGADEDESDGGRGAVPVTGSAVTSGDIPGDTLGDAIVPTRSPTTVAAAEAFVLAQVDRLCAALSPGSARGPSSGYGESYAGAAALSRVADESCGDWVALIAALRRRVGGAGSDTAGSETRDPAAAVVALWELHGRVVEALTSPRPVLSAIVGDGTVRRLLRQRLSTRTRDALAEVRASLPDPR